MEKALNYIDIFAGCGGLSTGLFNAGWHGLFAVEKNADAFSTLKFNLIDTVPHFVWPEWLSMEAHDINELISKNEDNLKALRGHVTLVAGGPPCQGFSMAGRVISKIVQRSEDLINLRGFVLDNTCDFELRIREVLTICWSKFTPEQKELLNKKMVEQLDGKCGRVKAQVGKAKKQACIYSYANNDDYMLGIADRLDILEVILPILISEYNMPSADELIHFKDYYINKVNMFRNRLGHVKLGEQVLHIQGKDVPIDQALHRMLRKNISEVEKTLLSIEKYVASQM